uniref:Uncharacterized protein n=1 Tax=Meloidogyne enterolobii TaxID=390850 RepID=A0A6V7U1E1_MELEN|nr:unnamed protein product [Meloidogyne enterolobii]
MKILIFNFFILLLIKQQINFINACSCLNLTVKIFIAVLIGLLIF